MDGNQTPSFEIPKNSAEQEPAKAKSMEYDRTLSIEGTKEVAADPQFQQIPATLPSTQLPAPGVISSATISSQPRDDQIIADDNDVIEKEWIDRAKKIIAMTSDDPFIETRELNKLKSKYMKKRFNKDILLQGEET